MNEAYIHKIFASKNITEDFIKILVKMHELLDQIYFFDKKEACIEIHIASNDFKLRELKTLLRSEMKADYPFSAKISLIFQNGKVIFS